MVTVEELLREPAGTVGVVNRPDGTRLRTFEAGDRTGPAAVLVHGYGISVAEWSLVMPALAERGFRVIGYNHRGHGGSTVGADGWSTAALFADLRAVVAHFDLTDAVLVGHSMGTFTVLGALPDAEFRTRVRAAVLVSTATGELLKNVPQLAKLQVPLARWGVLQRMAASPRFGGSVVAQAFGPDAAPEMKNAMRLAFAAIPRESARLLSAMGSESVRSGLSSISTPLRLLLGEFDTVTPRWRSQEVLDAVPDATLTEVPAAGHMMNWEQPEAIVTAVIDAAAAN